MGPVINSQQPQEARLLAMEPPINSPQLRRLEALKLARVKSKKQALWDLHSLEKRKGQFLTLLFTP